MTSILPGLSAHDAAAEPDSALWGPPPAPGWDIWVDLTPPELVTARQVRRLRRWLAAGLVVLVLLVLAGFGYGMLRRHAAETDLAAVQARTAELTRQTNSYGDAVKLDTATRTYVTTLSDLTAGDVDSTKVLAEVQAALPKGMTLTELRTTVTSVASTAAAGSSGTSATSTDPLAAAGQTSVGSVTVSGTAPKADGIPAFAAALARQPGLTAVVPTTTQAQQGGYQYSMTLDLDSALVTESVADQFAAVTGGTK